MIGPNLSEWAVQRRSLIVYFMIAAVLAGTLSFFRLGRNEDPAFEVRTMVVQAVWPGRPSRTRSSRSPSASSAASRKCPVSTT